MTKSAESVNEIGTKQIRSTGSGSKNNQTEPDRQEKQCCPLRNLVQNMKQEGGKPSIDRMSLGMNRLPSSDRASALMALQSTRGNRYVQRVVAQAKLAISQPGDQYELEADRVAEQVMGMSESHNIQRKCQLRNKDYALNTKGTSGQPPSSIPGINVPILVDGVLGSPGQPLDSATRTFMEPRLGHDFGHVRVHIDKEAAKSARVINALAFTVGSDIVFGKGQYAPEASEGGKLLAHELTHVIQQESGLESHQADNVKEASHKFPNISSASELIQRREVCDEQGNCQSVQDDEPIASTEPTFTNPMEPEVLMSGAIGNSTNYDWTELPPENLENPEFPKPPRLPDFRDTSKWDPNEIPEELRVPESTPEVTPPRTVPRTDTMPSPGNEASAAEAESTAVESTEAAEGGEAALGGTGEATAEGVTEGSTGFLGGIGLGAALVGLSAFAATMLWSNKTAPAWMDEINPITRKPYSSQEEYDRVHGKQ